jgi:hypothetical protein
MDKNVKKHEESNINRGYTNVHVSTRRYDKETVMDKISLLLKHFVICDALGILC